jgi:hypothetical protein
MRERKFLPGTGRNERGTLAGAKFLPGTGSWQLRKQLTEGLT